MQVSTETLTQAAVKQLTDTLLKSYCLERSQHAQRIDERYALLWKSVQTLLLSGGKRFRPYMLLLAYTAYSKDDSIEGILPAIIAQEILHSAMLIHDDIIDRDTIRYGVKNITGQYEDSYATLLSDTSERYHMATSAAILAGDMLLSDSHRLIWEITKPVEVLRQTDAILSKAIFDVIGGELLDTEAAILPKGIISAAHVARFKTASYSFVSPLTMGATLADADMSEIKLLTHLAEQLGIGYQLRDDLLGVFGESVQTGKSTSTDIKEGKRTVLVEQFDTLATQGQFERFYELFHRDNLTDQETNEAKQLLDDSGAKKAVEDMIKNIELQSEALIDTLSIDKVARGRFQQLINDCLNREV